MKAVFKDILILISLTLLITTLVWLPFYLKLENLWGLNFSQGLSTIYRNFDGLEYIVIAKSLYQPEIISSLPLELSPNYYAAHFPGYALSILSLAPLIGFLKSMLLSSLLFTIGSVIIFYFLVKNFRLTSHPLFLSFVFLILPARWLIVHSVGSAEPMFIFFLLLAMYFFMKYEENKNWNYIFLTAIFGMLTQFVRPPGILLFLALGLYILWKNFFLEKAQSFQRKISSVLGYFPLLLIPLTLILVFSWYSFTFKDFFAYFHSGDNIHLVFPPFQVFNINQPWVGSIWLEDIIFTFILGFLAGITLLKQKLYPMAFFVLTYLGASIFVAHRDISRYILPVFPFVLIAFEKVLTSKEFKIVLIIVCLAIYLYAENFLINNVAPVANLELFD